MFDNKVKGEAAELITKLKEANIESRMITGDNIHVAMETSMRCGILADEHVIVFEGKNQLRRQADKTFTGKELKKVDGFTTHTELHLSEDEFKTQTCPIAIDN